MKGVEVTLTKAFLLGRTEVTQGQWELVMGNNPSHSKGKNLPVDSVTWNDAQEFCGKLNAKSLLPAGWRFALPSEAQWECACRAETTGDYAGSLAYVAKAWGLCDKLGNVWEWCADWYDNYPSRPLTNPAGPNRGSHRVIRGGSWDYVRSVCHSAARSKSVPDIQLQVIGFRVAAVPGGS